MNNGQQGGQPAQGQPAGAQQPQRKMVFFKPEQMRNLPDQFSAEEKAKWETGLRALWTQIEKNAPDSQPHQDAKRKLFEFSRTLTMKLQANRTQGSQQGQQGQQGTQGQGQAARPPSQGQPVQATGGEGNAAPNQAAAGQQQPKPQPKISSKLMEHVTNFPYVLPPQLTAGSPEAAKWLQDAKQRYLKALMSMEGGSQRVQALENVYQKRNEEGKPFSPEEEKDFKEKKEAAQKAHADAKTYVDNFRAQQSQNRAASQANAAQQASGAGNAAPTQAPPTRPQMNVNQPATNPALQNTQTVNAAIEAARNQQMGAGRPSMAQGQMPQGVANANNPANPNMAQGGPHIKMEGGVPPQINTAITQMQQNGRQMQTNSPQSAVPRSAGIPQSGGGQPQVPQALSHTDALTQAARSYSNPAPPNVMGGGHPSHIATPREPNTITNKMPIPKHLPERATAPPQPVQMSSARPTYSGGPSNIGNGVLGQPVLAKAPGFNMEGEGDRVLSKKKLDELVRQVTGGGQGLEGGEGLTPDVEESILNVADNFVDQVLQAACKNAKERGSKTLEIRDIQLTLERGYNIRIPGYSSDEIRTVRKIQPSANWIAKMSAVQAAKVTGGKNSD